MVDFMHHNPKTVMVVLNNERKQQVMNHYDLRPDQVAVLPLRGQNYDHIILDEIKKPHA